MPDLSCRRRLLVGSCLVLALMLVGVVTAAAQTEPAAAPEVHLAFGVDVDRTTRALVGENSEFAVADFTGETGQIYCLTQLSGMVPPTTVTHVWYYNGKTMARVELKVGGASWRTWSSKNILPSWTGPWEVKVVDADGVVLGSAGFTIN